MRPCCPPRICLVLASFGALNSEENARSLRHFQDSAAQTSGVDALRKVGAGLVMHQGQFGKELAHADRFCKLHPLTSRFVASRTE